jgi:hypothetical protein
MSPESNPVLFQQDRLIVSKNSITVGSATVFYPNISSTRIYEGRPLIMMAFAGIAGLLPLGFFLFSGSRLFGGLFPTKAIFIMLLPLLTMIAVGIVYKVQCLIVGIQGQSVSVLKSKNLLDLESAQRAIEDAKRAYETA